MNYNLFFIFFRYVFFHYSGDQDSVIPLTGSRTLVQRLAKELKLKTTVPYRVWFEDKQVHTNTICSQEK